MNTKMILAPGFWPGNQIFPLVLYKSITIRIVIQPTVALYIIKDSSISIVNLAVVGQKLVMEVVMVLQLIMHPLQGHTHL